MRAHGTNSRKGIRADVKSLTQISKSDFKQILSWPWWGTAREAINILIAFLHDYYYHLFEFFPILFIGEAVLDLFLIPSRVEAAYAGYPNSSLLVTVGQPRFFQYPV